jgi:hypothetical protein
VSPGVASPPPAAVAGGTSSPAATQSVGCPSLSPAAGGSSGAGGLPTADQLREAVAEYLSGEAHSGDIGRV